MWVVVQLADKLPWMYFTMQLAIITSSVSFCVQAKKETFELLKLLNMIYVNIVFIWKHVGGSAACPDDSHFVCDGK